MGSIKKHGDGAGSITIPPPGGAGLGGNSSNTVGGNPGAGGGSTIGMASGVVNPNVGNLNAGGGNKKNYMSPYS